MPDVLPEGWIHEYDDDGESYYTTVEDPTGDAEGFSFLILQEGELFEPLVIHDVCCTSCCKNFGEPADEPEGFASLQDAVDYLNAWKPDPQTHSFCVDAKVSNSDRAKRGQAAMDAYMRALTDSPVPSHYPRDSPGFEQCLMISDLIADLMHLHDATECEECRSPEQCLNRAHYHWNHERERSS